MTTYWRRMQKSDVWHWVERCRWYPTRAGSYLERTRKPYSGELCDECVAKTKAKTAAHA